MIGIYRMPETLGQILVTLREIKEIMERELDALPEDDERES